MARTGKRTMTTRRVIKSGNDRLRGTVEIIQEGPRAFAVERSDVDGTYDRMEGFRTFKQAIEEFNCYRG